MNNNKERLNTKFLNTTFQSPIGVTSGPYGYITNNNYVDIINENEWGFISLKGVTLNSKIGNSEPVIIKNKTNFINSVGAKNPGILNFINQHYSLFNKNFKPKLFLNIIGKNAEEYLKISTIIQQLPNIKFVELNLSCPNINVNNIKFINNIDSIYQITKKVKEKLKNKKLIVKLSPNIPDIASAAFAAQKGGADALTLTNTIKAIDINFDTLKPSLGNIFGGLSGPGLMPISLRAVYDAYKVCSIPIIGTGGIENYQDVIKYIAAGASVVAMGTILFSKPDIATIINNDLINYCIKNNLKNINEVVGIAHYQK